MRAKKTVSAPSPTPRTAAVKLRAHVLDVPFAMRATATSAGARWDADNGVFVWRGAALPKALAPFRAQPYSWELAVERELNDDDAPPPSKPAATMVPRAHQRDAIRAITATHASGRGGFLLADDVGLGKTLSAWEAVRTMPGVATVLIVRPLAVVAHWRRTIEAAGDGGREVVVINYDRLGKLFEVSAEARKKVRSKKGLARAGSAPEYDVVVWDESHRCKNPSAARSKLAAKINARAGFTLWLSATAGLRRRPEDIAGWPEINRILTPIALDAAARERYAQAWSEFRAAIGLEPSGRDPRTALAAALRLRQKSSLIRAEGTVELVHELLENGHQVAVSVAFLETLEIIRDALARDGVACALVHGRLGAEAREAERMRFQRGEVPVALFTVEEGISLHQGEHNDVPRSEVIHDLRWSAIQMAQIEGRCHRDGRFAQVYWAYADDTVEERLAAVVCRRLLSMKSMVGDDVETLKEIERLLADAARDGAR